MPTNPQGSHSANILKTEVWYSALESTLQLAAVLLQCIITDSVMRHAAADVLAF